MSLRGQHRAAVLAAVMASQAFISMGWPPLRPRRTYGVRKCRSRRPPYYHRAALLLQLQTDQPTSWKKLLSCSVGHDFLVSTNFTKDLIIQNLLPQYEIESASFNFGSPYRSAIKRKGRMKFFSSLHLLGLELWYFKGKETLYSLCSMLRIGTRIIRVWLDYNLEVLQCVLSCKERIKFEVRWPTVEEMKASATLLEVNRINGALLSGVFAITDFGRIPCPDLEDLNLQNAYYESFNRSVKVTNLSVFKFFGEIIHGAVD